MHKYDLWSAKSREGPPFSHFSTALFTAHGASSRAPPSPSSPAPPSLPPRCTPHHPPPYPVLSIVRRLLSTCSYARRGDPVQLPLLPSLLRSSCPPPPFPVRRSPQAWRPPRRCGRCGGATRLPLRTPSRRPHLRLASPVRAQPRPLRGGGVVLLGVGAAAVTGAVAGAVVGAEAGVAPSAPAPALTPLLFPPAPVPSRW